jgi:hypothetical protein
MTASDSPSSEWYTTDGHGFGRGSSSISLCYYTTGQPEPTDRCACWHFYTRGDDGEQRKYTEEEAPEGHLLNTDCDTYRCIVSGIDVSEPWDVDDFGRCHHFLRAVPEARAKLDVMTRFPNWAPLVKIWPELESMYETDPDKVTERLRGLREDREQPECIVS